LLRMILKECPPVLSTLVPIRFSIRERKKAEHLIA